jgi:hypothetical protein
MIALASSHGGSDLIEGRRTLASLAKIRTRLPRIKICPEW